MTPEETERHKTQFIALCRQYIRRDEEGLDKLLDYLDKSDFYTAPSSASFHLNEAGGLCRHSINVFETALHLHRTWLEPKRQEGLTAFEKEISEESIAIAALFHDLCKVHFYKPTERFRKDDNGRWVTYPGYVVEDKFPFGHGEKSCLIVGWFLRLQQHELLAIRWHMGMFEMAPQGSGMSYSYRSAMDAHPLVALLQVSDMLAANCLEKTTVY